ncbi:GLPGLI family protein [Empedobacter stercoris]|uniref:GLPGLI family protein n=1 Tax=Empedobacter falsenii TaxID=343874 RepID=A0ABY8VCQ3_9FLAO|nr:MULTISPECIES: GLPGLI family protein [Empedobacter]MDM1521909.1 GLPGLI family protein [Empedobacter sp. 225-1]MDM1541727.1 GLPGLI family protein [Empedobacter sp. 189-2]UWX68284.1 GLPGLI family protein [Empedobacter stercoris]WIH98443.1 GLPGLI family protein [Empedobacter falsenii]
MKKLFLLTFLMFFVLLNGQSNNLVEYNFITKNGVKEVMKEYLVFNENEIFYVNIKNDDNLNYEDDKLAKERYNYEPIYVNLKTDSLYQNKIAILKKNSSEMKRIIMVEKRPTVNWKITKESQKMLGYTCYKATTKFRGRDYTAWFTPELPYNYGPWKLGGLPGLILKVENELFDYDATRIVLNSNKIPTLPILKSFVNAKYKYQLKQAIGFENNWLIYNRANIYASLPSGVIIKEEPLRKDVREFSIDE